MASRKTNAGETPQPVQRDEAERGGDAPEERSAQYAAAADPPGGGGGAAGSTGDPLSAALAERDANRENWLRSQAELENYRKRVQREADEARRYQAQPLARDVLPVLDNLRRAITAAEEGGDTAGLVDGVRLVLKQLEDALARHGIQPIEAVGQPFDPHLHEAVQQVASPDQPPLNVVQEFQRGYRLHDRVLRPSQVVVSSGPPE
jgi:molecular chaperone GrpE